MDDNYSFVIESLASLVASTEPDVTSEISDWLGLFQNLILATHNVTSLADSGVIELLAAIIIKFKDNSNVVVDSLTLFVLILVEDESFGPRMVSAGIVDLALDARNFVDTTTCREDLLLLVLILRDTPESREYFISKGGVECVMEELVCSENTLDRRAHYVIILLGTLTDTLKNRRKLSEKGAVKLVIDYMARNMSSDQVFVSSLYFLGCVSLNSIPIKAEIGRLGGLELMISVIKKCPDNQTIQGHCLSSLWNSTWGVSKNKIVAAEYGGVSAVIGIMKKHPDNEDIQRCGCGTLENILSIDDVHSKYCTEDVINTVERSQARFPNCGKLKQTLSSIKRIQDPRVIDSVAKGVCTKLAFPKCVDKDCGCDKNIYCPKCCIQQNSYRCIDCDGEYSIKMYCEVCWKKFHANHKCVKMFVSSRCLIDYVE